MSTSSCASPFQTNTGSSFISLRDRRWTNPWTVWTRQAPLGAKPASCAAGGQCPVGVLREAPGSSRCLWKIGSTWTRFVDSTQTRKDILLLWWQRNVRRSDLRPSQAGYGRSARPTKQFQVRRWICQGLLLFHLFHARGCAAA